MQDRQLHPSSAEVWTRHWATGAPHSCAGSFGATYGGGLAEFWRRVHAVTGSGASVLDVATGNGAVLRVLDALRPDLACQMIGVDAATVSPTWPAELPDSRRSRLHWRSGVDAAALPWPDASFDLVVSQYGIEYAEPELALTEALRVRAPSGRIALVVHHAASRPMALAAIELRHLDWLESEGGLLSATERILAPMALSATPQGRASLARDATADAARRSFNEAQAELTMRAADADGSDVLHEVRDAVGQLLGLAVQRGEHAARRAMLSLRSALADSRLRLDDLRRCALDEAAAQGWVMRMRDAGMTVELGTVTESGHLMGWTMLAQPRD